MSIQMIASADNHTIRKANEAMHDIGVVPMRPAGLAGIGLLCGGAAQPAESEPRLLPMPTGRRTADADRWAAAWVTKATGAELRRLGHFSFRRSEEKVDPRTVSHTGAWAHFVNKLERCVVAHTRAELGVANVDRSRRFSPCDALDTVKNRSNRFEVQAAGSLTRAHRGILQSGTAACGECPPLCRNRRGVAARVGQRPHIDRRAASKTYRQRH